MGHYVPITPAEELEMLHAVGAERLEDLYRDVPAEMLLHDGDLNLAPGKSELEVQDHMTALAAENKVFPTVLRGAGAYRHYIPAAVKRIVSREEFVTAYTPYQAEISQGILQSIFEYQTMICELTGMDVSNASVYDGATAAAEATAMCRDRKRQKVYVSACVHPQVLEVVKTYCFGSDTEVTVIPARDGRTDADALEALVGADAACVLIQQPNYFGQLEDMDVLEPLVHKTGAKLILSMNPIACALLPTPAEYGADVAVGEGQPLGLPMGFGGPYLGFMAATQAMMRKLPGRIVGQTVDTQGRRGFVLTLTAREQHIRREKASSNICSNEAHCALTASVYMSAMGPEGMAQAAQLCCNKAHYLAAELTKAGLPLLYTGEFFHEFVTACDESKSQAILAALETQDILGGQPVEGGLLWCATEVVTKDAMDKAVSIVKEVLAQ